MKKEQILWYLSNAQDYIRHMHGGAERELARNAEHHILCAIRELAKNDDVLPCQRAFIENNQLRAPSGEDITWAKQQGYIANDWKHYNFCRAAKVVSVSKDAQDEQTILCRIREACSLHCPYLKGDIDVASEKV